MPSKIAVSVRLMERWMRVVSSDSGRQIDLRDDVSWRDYAGSELAAVPCVFRAGEGTRTEAIPAAVAA